MHQHLRFVATYFARYWECVTNNRHLVPVIVYAFHNIYTIQETHKTTNTRVCVLVHVFCVLVCRNCRNSCSNEQFTQSTPLSQLIRFIKVQADRFYKREPLASPFSDFHINSLHVPHRPRNSRDSQTHYKHVSCTCSRFTKQKILKKTIIVVAVKINRKISNTFIITFVITEQNTSLHKLVPNFW